MTSRRTGTEGLTDGTAPVLYVLKRYPRLSETFVVREIAGLEGAGQRVLIDSLMPAEAGPRHPEAEAVRASVRYVPAHPKLRQPAVLAAHVRVAGRSPRAWLSGAVRARRSHGWRRFLQGGMVADRAHRSRVEHLHAHFATAAAEVAGEASRVSGLSFSVTAHAKDIFHAHNAPVLAERLTGASTVVTVSHHNVAHLQRVVPGVPVTLVTNGVEVAEPFVADPAGPVLSVARLVSKKGLDVLVDAVALAATEGRTVPVEVVGGGEQLDALVARCRAAGVEADVRFLGPLPSPQVEAAYRRCSMAVLACRVTAEGDRDGMPTVLVEAMAHGLPVISTDVAGIPELVRDGVTGLLVPPEDPAALASAILRLIDDPALGRRLGAAGRQLVSDAFDPCASTVALLDVFARGTAHCGARRTGAQGGTPGPAPSPIVLGS